MGAFVVTLHGELASKKNGKVIRRDRHGRVLGLIENAKVRKVEARLVGQLTEALTGKPRPFFPGQSLELAVTIDKDRDVTHIAVIPISEKPKGKTGRKRDIQNELGVICDALERAGVVANDNQFARIVIARIVQGNIC